MSPSALEVLLRKSRMNNSTCGVSGVLLYTGGNFLQVLEGPRHAVMDTYNRIRLSKLHSGVTELISEAAPARQFAGWSMAYTRATWENLVRIQEAFVPNAPAATGMDLLKNFWSANRASPIARPLPVREIGALRAA
jgi:hypothetical protein